MTFELDDARIDEQPLRRRYPLPELERALIAMLHAAVPMTAAAVSRAVRQYTSCNWEPNQAARFFRRYRSTFARNGEAPQAGLFWWRLEGAHRIYGLTEHGIRAAEKVLADRLESEAQELGDLRPGGAE